MQHSKSKAIVSCPSCAATALTRNHYFTGKLMVERDFTDEQRYFRERLRLHNQRLHGTGVACGLLVHQHDNPACQDRYVVLDPGSAIDCCGNDILVVEPETIDLQAFPQVRALVDDGKDHVLQFCICYRDCPTEQIPVLYDECGCDDSQRAPNRILETYAIDVKVDPPPTPAEIDRPTLSRTSTIGIARATAVALDDAGARVFVMSGGTPSAIYQVSASTEAVETSYSLGRQGLAMALSPDATRLYVVVATDPPGTDTELWVFDVSGPTTLATVAAKTGTIAGTSTEAPSLAVASGGELLAGFKTAGKVYAWAAPVDPTVTPDSAALAGVTSVVCSSDGKTAWAANATSTLTVLDLETTGMSPTTLEVTGTELSTLAVVRSTGADVLLAGDVVGPTQKIDLIDPAKPSPTLPISTVTLASTPIAVAVSPGGKWAYVDLDTDAVQIVDVDRMRLGLPTSASTPFAVGPVTGGIAISATGDRLFVPYAGAAPDGSDGGVAVIDVTETDCCGPLHEVRPCPDCGRGDCVVLATVRRYRPGYRLLDPVDPAPSPADDAAAKVARIDDLDGRKILASTQTLQEVIECLCAHGTGGTPGPQGPPGAPGANGTNGTNGTNGKDGPGLQTKIPHVMGASWLHGGFDQKLVDVTTFDGKTTVQGLVIGFSHPVHIVGPALTAPQAQQYRRNVFQVWVPDLREVRGLLCRCPIDGLVVPVEPTYVDTVHKRGAIASATIPAPPFPPGILATGLALVPLKAIEPGSEVWVKLLGELVVDGDGNAIDADFVRRRFPSGNRTMPFSTPADPDDLLSIQGGVFESWFTTIATATAVPIGSLDELPRFDLKP